MILFALRGLSSQNAKAGHEGSDLRDGRIVA
jgi:hypothetical protein